MKRLFTALLFLAGSSLSAQTVMINGEKTTRNLQWEDFAGPADYTTDLFAYTYWYVSYKWDPFLFKGDTVKWKVNVLLELGKNSWRKPEKTTDLLLEHEQGHFNIGWLFAIAFQKKVTSTVFFRHNYESRIAEIFKEELEKFRKMELQYDKETEHFYNREQQKKWNQFFKEGLDKYR